MPSYIWMQTALLQPAVFLLRMTVGPRDPTLIVVLAAAGMVAVVIGAGRVVKSGFRLDSVGGGAFVVVAGGIISYLIDGVPQRALDRPGAISGTPPQAFA